MTDLRLYNSLNKRTEPFKQKGSVQIYSCGPTVYDRVHVGNLRYFTVTDILRRYLEYKGYRVKQVMNITDVGHLMADSEDGEDKIEAAAKRAGVKPEEITKKYTELFFSDIKALNIKPAEYYPKATEHVNEMIKMIGELLAKGFAYEVNGSVYYDLSKFPDYGRLSGNTVANLIAGARVEVAAGKRNPYDFALWISKPGHLMQWSAPWGKGYPGWHIECSAMARKYLGNTLDIHTGGEDNKFPHHEAEIAQTEAASGKTLARYWFHVAHLLSGGEKMSKSLGNFYTLDDIIAHGYSPRELRYLLLSVHYRDAINFTFESLQAARSAVARLDELWNKLCRSTHGGRALVLSLVERTKLGTAIKRATVDFESAMDDDLNTSGALAAVMGFVREANSALSAGIGFLESWKARRFMAKIDSVLGIGFGYSSVKDVPEDVLSLVSDREAARKRKDFKAADMLRSAIKSKGFDVEDTSSGSELKRI